MRNYAVVDALVGAVGQAVGRPPEMAAGRPLVTFLETATDDGDGTFGGPSRRFRCRPGGGATPTDDGENEEGPTVSAVGATAFAALVWGSVLAVVVVFLYAGELLLAARGRTRKG